MPYRNQYNEMIADDIERINRKYVDFERMTGQSSGEGGGMSGGFLGALSSMVLPMVVNTVANKLFGGADPMVANYQFGSARKDDSYLEGGAGFAQGSFMDTGFDTTLGAIGEGGGMSAGVREYQKNGLHGGTELGLPDSLAGSGMDGCGDCGCGYGLSGGAEFMESELEEAKKMLDDEVKRCKDEQDEFHKQVNKKLEEIENIRQKINEIKTIDMKEKRGVCRTTIRDKRRNIKNIEKSQSKHARDLERQQNKFAKEQLKKLEKDIAEIGKEQEKQQKKAEKELVKAIEKQAKADQPKQPKTPKPRQKKAKAGELVPDIGDIKGLSDEEIAKKLMKQMGITLTPAPRDQPKELMKQMGLTLTPAPRDKPKKLKDKIVEVDGVDYFLKKEKGKEVLYEIITDEKGNQKKGKKVGFIEDEEFVPLEGKGMSGGRKLIPVANMPASMMTGGGIEDLKRYQAKLKQVRAENPSLSLKEARQMLKDGAFDRQIKQRRKYTKKVEGKKELPDALKMFNAKVKELRQSNPGLSLKDAREQVKQMKGSGFFDDFADGFMSVIRPVAKVAKMLPTPLSPVLSAIGLGKSRGQMHGEGVEDLKKYQALVKEARLRGMSLKEARDYVKQGNFFGKQKRTYTKKTPGVNKRAEIVKKVMKDRGVSMIQASKIVKAEGLYQP